MFHPSGAPSLPYLWQPTNLVLSGLLEWIHHAKFCTLHLSCLIMSFASLITAFSTNVWMYSSLRLVSGFGRASILTCSLLLFTERVGKQWRVQIGTTTLFSFSLGLLGLPAIAYLSRGSSWRIIYLWTSIPSNLALYYSIFLCVWVS